jgi:hypothetical protein
MAVLSEGALQGRASDPPDRMAKANTAGKFNRSKEFDMTDRSIYH